MEKDVQFAFRCEAHLRSRFIQACKTQDRSAGQVLREFMRDFVSRTAPETQSAKSEYQKPEEKLSV